MHLFSKSKYQSVSLKPVSLFTGPLTQNQNIVLNQLCFPLLGHMDLLEACFVSLFLFVILGLHHRISKTQKKLKQKPRHQRSSCLSSLAVSFAIKICFSRSLGEVIFAERKAVRIRRFASSWAARSSAKTARCARNKLRNAELAERSMKEHLIVISVYRNYCKNARYSAPASSSSSPSCCCSCSCCCCCCCSGDSFASAAWA